MSKMQEMCDKIGKESDSMKDIDALLHDLKSANKSDGMFRLLECLIYNNVGSTRHHKFINLSGPSLRMVIEALELEKSNILSRLNDCIDSMQSTDDEEEHDEL